MTAFEVYLVMQADNISQVATIFFVYGCLAALMLKLVYALERNEGCQRWFRIISFVSVFSGVIWVLMPNSKTIAAMYVVPAITSNKFIEPVGREAKEVYDLAKKALKNLAEDKDEDRSK